ncbi:NAD(P)-dependent oxidoreductase [Chryseomicrobium aureum]|uniref:NAD(P)-dependent oxidoreductase n=1 Tax=Chryseomicrobium aureum TaxID=1441723 RepID=UPI00370D35F3
MKLAIFGGTGRVGKQVVDMALQGGHEVQLLVRTQQDWMDQPGITAIVGDAKNPEDVAKTVQGTDAVFSGLGTDKTTTLTEFIEGLIPALAIAEISRVVTIGTAGILDSRTTPGVYRFQSGESNRKLTFAAEQHAHVYETFRDSDLDWTIICPTYLPDGPLTKTYRTEESMLPVDGKHISTADTAHCAYTALSEGTFNRVRVGLAY